MNSSCIDDINKIDDYWKFLIFKKFSAIMRIIKMRKFPLAKRLKKDNYDEKIKWKLCDQQI